MSTSSGPKRVFVTRLTYAADVVRSNLCQNVAEAASLGGRWTAWLSRVYSTNRYNAIDEVQGRGPWLLVTGETVFENHGQLATLPLVPIDTDEFGKKLTPPASVWTGTSTGGIGDSADCQAWSETRSLFSGAVGDPTSLQKWTFSTYSSCDYTHHLYCFEN